MEWNIKGPILLQRVKTTNPVFWTLSSTGLTGTLLSYSRRSTSLLSLFYNRKKYLARLAFLVTDFHGHEVSGGIQTTFGTSLAIRGIWLSHRSQQQSSRENMKCLSNSSKSQDSSKVKRENFLFFLSKYFQDIKILVEKHTNNQF
jgi:hypothetical protein